MPADTVSPLHESSSERRYHETNAAYVLPNDNTEHKRLEVQADLLREMMKGQTTHVPLDASATHKALDIGCGTGIVTHHIASQVPNAQVYGLDLSPVPFVREKLPNIEYIQANFNDLTNPKDPDPRFGTGTFDYVFSRLLVLGMTNWKDYVNRCVALTKPGGWIEMQDLAISYYRAPDPLTPSQRAALEPHSLNLSEFKSQVHPTDTWHNACDWAKTFQELCAAKAMDATCGQQLPGMFSAAGLEDVHIKRYTYAVAPWEGLTKAEKKFGEFHRDNMGLLIPRLIKKLAEGQHVVSQEDVEKACEGAERDAIEWREQRGFVFFYVVYGRKPKP
ncbi:S-adenosyl-L-methionine-dependent methyltransferase [Phaeosphaeria sp. MPI-PUGE-AT-0046c]|nr:S-adenosyl-L-methionine-dependent methyltransferase [Phaeosphaeria sp. MPI-PUGE-AT-0046c]